ncbi:MAG: hypothetical protein J0L94_10860 [Rhodothermia bacterium]|nr:hypothetical protein [Rhodothermia bacterium]
MTCNQFIGCQNSNTSSASTHLPNEIVEVANRDFLALFDRVPVYTLDFNGEIQEITPSYIFGTKQPVFSQPNKLLFHNDSLFISDTKDHSIKILNTVGKLIKEIGRKGQAPMEFNEPGGIFKTKNGYFIEDVINNRTQFLSNNLKYIDSLPLVSELGRRGFINDQYIYIFLKARRINLNLFNLLKAFHHSKRMTIFFLPYLIIMQSFMD